MFTSTKRERKREREGTTGTRFISSSERYVKQNKNVINSIGPRYPVIIWLSKNVIFTICKFQSIKRYRSKPKE